MEKFASSSLSAKISVTIILLLILFSFSLAASAGIQPMCVPKCGNGIIESGEECDDGNTKNGDGCSSTCKIEPITIIAYKIVCDNEANLPNWGLGGPDINLSTAQNFVNSHPSCYFDKNWLFQWAYGGTKNPGDNTGEASVSKGWKTFGPTNTSGKASTTISDLKCYDKIWVREAFKQGYIPFSYSDNNNNSNNVSAEMYCYNDVENYDNYDFIGNPHLGKTYYCIAWNALKKYECTTDVNCSDGLYCNGAERCNLEMHKCEKGTSIDCNSLNDQCNSGFCDENKDACVKNPVENGKPCGDKVFCTYDEVCINGQCTNGKKRDCSEYNIFGISSCFWDPDNLDYTLDYRPTFTSVCDENLDKCTEGDKTITHTVDERCTQCMKDSDCNSTGNQCTENKCIDYKCVEKPKPSSTSCDNGTYCDGADHCNGEGSCISFGTPVDCSYLTDQCNNGLCDEADKTCIKKPVENGVVCNDGLFCNVGEVCVNGTCDSGKPRDCSDNNIFGIATCFWDPDNINYTWDYRASFTSVCNEAIDQCTTGDETITHTIDPRCTHCVVDANCPATGNQCTENKCIQYECVETPKPSSTVCENGTYCDGADHCDGQGTCVPLGPPVDCSYLTDQCNSGKCDEEKKDCVKQPVNDGTACSDGFWCTVGDICLNGGCTGGSERDCSGYNIFGIASCFWNPDNLDYTFDYRPEFVSACSEEIDQCTKGDETISHTVDEECAECMSDLDCEPTGNQCTENKCINYECVEKPKPFSTSCKDGTFCNGIDHCDGEGKCVPLGEPIDCSSLNDQCNKGICDEEIEECVKEPLANGTACTDGLWCTDGDTCFGGNCNSGNSRDCSDLDLPPVGQCNYLPDGYPKTFDFFAGFTSVCDEEKDLCTTGKETIESHCSVKDCSAECETDLDCKAHQLGDYCFYRGTCGGTPDCACNFDQQFCPEPGTIIEGYCYWGNGGCSENGCDLNKTAMDCYKKCDPLIGPTELPTITTKKTAGQPKIECNYFGDSQEAKECLLVTSDTEFTLDANYAGAKTYYRQRWKKDYNSAWGSWTSWVLYNGAFTKAEDSIHELEYYSIDEVCNIEEQHNFEIDIVDSNAPVALKTVGEPKSKWDGADSIFYPAIKDQCWKGENPLECWKVTLLTPIRIECNDPQPHPSGEEKICFYAELDADNATPAYCEKYDGTINEADNYCCIESKSRDFYFSEETEHNLKYYCTDALGNKSAVDDEKFKVGGTKFWIELKKKWNLISIPFTLTDSNIANVLKDIKTSVESVWRYDAFNDKWLVYRPSSPGTSSLFTLEPGWGYWLAAYENCNLLIGGSSFNPAITLPSRQLKKGWNMIGYYGTDGIQSYSGPVGAGKTAGCALYSLGSSVWDKGWTSLLTYWEPDNPNQWKYLGYNNGMDPGAGYWVLASENSTYESLTTCGS